MSTLITITNRATHQVAYTLPDSHIRREFAGGETKRLDLDEIRQLSWTTGGKRMLEKYLIINDSDAREQIFGKAEVEPEYLYTKEEVTKLLLNGTVDELEDCLNFGTEGVADLVVEAAVETEVPNTNKRDLIFRKTGYDINHMIQIKKANEDKTEQVNEKPQRHAPAPQAPTRKVNKPTWD